MRATEFISEGVDAKKVLQYVKRAHAPDEFDIEHSITDHPSWELKNIPVSQLNLDPEGEHQDPYGRVNWVDWDKVQDLLPNISAVLKRMPIVVDSEGWIIDGNHRATAAAEAGLKSVPAYVPTALNEDTSNSPWLYHATYRPLLKSIKAHGLGGDRAQAKWEDSKPGVVYLARDPNVAESYAESSDVVPDEWLDQIIVLKINAGQLDQSRLSADQNVQGNSGDTLEYHGVIPVASLSLTENFADGKVQGKSRPGRVKRSGASCNGSVTDLRAKARKYGGERGKMYHWCANMKGGKK